MRYTKSLPSSPRAENPVPFRITSGLQGGQEAHRLLSGPAPSHKCFRRLRPSDPPPSSVVSKRLQKAGTVTRATPHGNHRSEVMASPANAKIYSSSWTMAPCCQNPVTVAFAQFAVGCGRKKMGFGIRVPGPWLRHCPLLTELVVTL